VIPIAIVVAALLVLLLGPRWYQRRRAREAARMKDLLQSGGTITQTRQKILTREFLANMPPGTPGIPRFVVMDWDTGGGMLTLVAADDGAVSAYFDFGSAIIGAGTHAQVRTAAVAFREEAKRLLPHFSPVQRYTVPDRSHAVIFLCGDGYGDALVGRVGRRRHATPERSIRGVATPGPSPAGGGAARK
jgi:hypothetical protein